MRHHHTLLDPPARLGLVVLAIAAIALAPSRASAGGLGCGAVLTQDTVLDQDIRNCTDDGLVIGAEGITVDLAGHTIDGSNSDDSAGIRNEGHDGVTVKNGVVSEFEKGVLLASGAAKNQIHDLLLTGGGGIFLFDSDFNVIDGNTAVDGSDGVFLEGSADNIVSDNRCARNVIGISVSFGSERNRIIRNVVRNNEDFGIEVSDSSFNTVARDVAHGNGFLAGIGLLGANDNRVRGNVATDNPIGIWLFSSDRNRLRSNRSVGNSVDGIAINSGSGGNVVQDNVAKRNGDDGIDVDDPATVLTRNAADENGDLGIEAVAGVTDGGGNTAEGNGNPAQCLNVSCS